MDLGLVFRYELIKGDCPSLNIVVRCERCSQQKVCSSLSLQEVSDSHVSFSLNFYLISTSRQTGRVKTCFVLGLGFRLNEAYKNVRVK